MTTSLITFKARTTSNVIVCVIAFLCTNAYFVSHTPDTLRSLWTEPPFSMLLSMSQSTVSHRSRCASRLCPGNQIHSLCPGLLWLSGPLTCHSHCQGKIKRAESSLQQTAECCTAPVKPWRSHTAAVSKLTKLALWSGTGNPKHLPLHAEPNFTDDTCPFVEGTIEQPGKLFNIKATA